MLIENQKNFGGLWIMSKCVNYKQNYTKSGRVYVDMKLRCLQGGYQQRKFPRYVGCTMSENFESFQFFAEWHMSQVGFGIEGYHIDKDILVEGNKLYSENTCVLVPAALNTFFLSHNASRGLYPQGVTLHGCGKFQASIIIDKRARHLGLFLNIDDAFQAYKIAKEKEARRWVARLEAGEFVVDQRVIDRMKVWTLTKE